MARLLDSTSPVRPRRKDTECRRPTSAAVNGGAPALKSATAAFAGWPNTPSYVLRPAAVLRCPSLSSRVVSSHAFSLLPEIVEAPPGKRSFRRASHARYTVFG